MIRWFIIHIHYDYIPIQDFKLEMESISTFLEHLKLLAGTNDVPDAKKVSVILVSCLWEWTKHSLYSKISYYTSCRKTSHLSTSSKYLTHTLNQRSSWPQLLKLTTAWERWSSNLWPIAIYDYLLSSVNSVISRLSPTWLLHVQTWEWKYEEVFTSRWSQAAKLQQGSEDSSEYGVNRQQDKKRFTASIAI